MDLVEIVWIRWKFYGFRWKFYGLGGNLWIRWKFYGLGGNFMD